MINPCKRFYLSLFSLRRRTGDADRAAQGHPEEVLQRSATVAGVGVALPPRRADAARPRRGVLRAGAEVARAAGGVPVQFGDAEESNEKRRDTPRGLKFLRFLREHAVQQDDRGHVAHSETIRDREVREIPSLPPFCRLSSRVSRRSFLREGTRG